MPDTPASSMKTLLIETFEGPGNEGSYFAESKPNTGIFGTLDGLSSEDASLSIHGSTIAAHSDHVRYYLWVVRKTISGEEFEKNWETSWLISHVDETTWTKIKQELNDEYTMLLEKIDSIEMGEWLTNVLGIIAHSAYHLGALRQMVKTIER